MGQSRQEWSLKICFVGLYIICFYANSLTTVLLSNLYFVYVSSSTKVCYLLPDLSFIGSYVHGPIVRLPGPFHMHIILSLINNSSFMYFGYQHGMYGRLAYFSPCAEPYT